MAGDATHRIKPTILSLRVAGKRNSMASMAPESNTKQVEGMSSSTKVSNSNKQVNKGAWTAEEDRILADVIAIHGPKRWQTIAAKAGLSMIFISKT